MWNNFTNSIFEANQTYQTGETWWNRKRICSNPTWKGRNETRREHQISSCTQEDCEWCSQTNGGNSTAGIEQHANLKRWELTPASQLHISRKTSKRDMNSALVFCSKLKLSRNIANDQHWSTDHHHVSTLAHHGFQRSFRGCTRLHLLHVSRQHEERVINGQGNSSGQSCFQSKLLLLLNCQEGTSRIKNTKNLIALIFSSWLHVSTKTCLLRQDS